MCVYKTNKLIKLRKMCMFPKLGFPKTSIHPFDFLSHRLLTHSTPATLVFLLHEREIDFFRKAFTHRCPFLKQYSLMYLHVACTFSSFISLQNTSSEKPSRPPSQKYFPSFYPLFSLNLLYENTFLNQENSYFIFFPISLEKQAP